MSMMTRRSPLAAPAGGDDEQRLVEGCRAGDARSLDRLFHAYVRRVETALGRMVGPTPDLEDLVQITFVEAVQSFHRFRGESSVATWLTRIAIHVAQHQLRRGVRRLVPLELLPAADEPADAAPSPERSLDDHRIAQRLHGLLDRIAPKKRLAFLLYTVEEYSIAEVAALMGAGQAATKSRIWFARRELAALVEKDPALAGLAEARRGGGR
jgi:RNA polymerase sigma-70 factor (ECF subfamily)